MRVRQTSENGGIERVEKPNVRAQAQIKSIVKKVKVVIVTIVVVVDVVEERGERKV